jgi:hypothetical protein
MFELRIKGVIQALIVGDIEQVRELNGHPLVSRVISPQGGLVHRLLATRIAEDLRFPEGSLPVFQRRGSDARRSRQEELERALAATSTAGPELAELAAFVTGKRGKKELEVIAQRWAGKLFDPAYRADRKSYRAARLLDGWVRRDPISAALLSRFGVLRRAKDLLLERAGGDLHAVHATSLALPNIIASLERMRKLASQPRLRERLDAPALAARSLAAPPALLRCTQGEVKVSFRDQPIPQHTLVVFPLRRIHDGTASDDIAFLGGEWSRCPARRVVLRLLEEVWAASGADARVQASAEANAERQPASELEPASTLRRRERTPRINGLEVLRASAGSRG